MWGSGLGLKFPFEPFQNRIAVAFELLGEHGVVYAAGFTVGAAEFHEFVVGALLDDFAIDEDDDAVGMHDGGEAVGDDEGGAVAHEVFEGILDEVFAGGVEGAGGFV